MTNKMHSRCSHSNHLLSRDPADRTIVHPRDFITVLSHQAFMLNIQIRHSDTVFDLASRAAGYFMDHCEHCEEVTSLHYPFSTPWESMLLTENPLERSLCAPNPSCSSWISCLHYIIPGALRVLLWMAKVSRFTKGLYFHWQPQHITRNPINPITSHWNAPNNWGPVKAFTKLSITQAHSSHLRSRWMPLNHVVTELQRQEQAPPSGLLFKKNFTCKAKLQDWKMWAAVNELAKGSNKPFKDSQLP